MIKTILLVDDDQTNIVLLKKRLQKDYKILNAPSGEEAFEIFCKEKLDLIILDLMLPGINGLEVLDKIREHEKDNGIDFGYGTPIIMLTASKESWMDGFTKGCNDYLVKPVDIDILLEKIQAKIK